MDVDAQVRKKRQGMCVRSMGMENVVSESVNQCPDPNAGQKIYLSMHGNRKDFNAYIFCFLCHGRIGLA
jgi:hypothetical protein